MAYILRRRKLGNTSCKAIAKFAKLPVTVVRNDHHIPDDDLCIRWGCTSNVPARKVFNKAEAIHLASDKTEFRKKLLMARICPITWFDKESKLITYPCIVRPARHHQGRHLYICWNKKDLDKAVGLCGIGYYISEYIDKDREFRVFVMQGRVLCVAEKTHPDKDAVAWNKAQGGSFNNVRWDEWPLGALPVALQAHALSGLDFSGVDIISLGNSHYVLEINSAPSLTSEYRQKCFAAGFDYMLTKGKEPIPLKNYEGWRQYIHPAIWTKGINRKEAE